MKNKFLCVLMTVLVMLLPLCGCTVQTKVSDELKIVCSIFVPYDFARQIVGDRASVKMLLPPGVESHSYEPTPSDIIEIENADLFLYVSENTETWVTQIVDSLSRKSVKPVDIADAMGIEVHEHHHEHGEEHEEHEGHEEHEEHEEHGEMDGHIWTSLYTAVKMVNAIADEICFADPENEQYYRANAKGYADEISALHGEFDSLVASSKRKEIVSGSRFALKNFTEELGIEYTAAFDSCVDNTEPSAGVMAHIIDRINEDNIPVIFYEELIEPKIASAVSLETGAKMLLLHSCHNVSVSEFKSGASYLSLMKQNYNNLKEALN